MRKRFLLCGLLAALLLAMVCGAALALNPSGANWPASPGSSLKKNGKLQVDAEHLSDGYFLASLQQKNSRRRKLRVIKGQETLTYNLNGDGAFEVFPLQLGDGKYEIQLYENVSGKKYSSAGKITVNVKLSNKEAPFYFPNQYVNYKKTTEAVAKAEELCKGKSAEEKYKTVCDFMGSYFAYDYIKALNIQAGVLPDIDGCYKGRKGICQDLSAVMCCMLRTQGLPARLMIGYADKAYHAWVVVYIGGREHFFDPTLAVNGIGKVKTYTVERYY